MHILCVCVCVCVAVSGDGNVSGGDENSETQQSRSGIPSSYQVRCSEFGVYLRVWGVPYDNDNESEKY